MFAKKPRLPSTEKRVIEEVQPAFLISSMVLATLTFAAVHLIYGPPLTFIAAGLLTLLTPPMAYGIQKSLSSGAAHVRLLRVTFRAMLNLYAPQQAAQERTALTSDAPAPRASTGPRSLPEDHP